MNLQHLEYFIALAKTEHMTHTAQELNTSQPNLSYMISELEKELGVCTDPQKLDRKSNDWGVF